MFSCHNNKENMQKENHETIKNKVYVFLSMTDRLLKNFRGLFLIATEQKSYLP